MGGKMSNLDFKEFESYQKNVRSKNWLACDLIADEHKELISDINCLKKQVDYYKKAANTFREQLKEKSNLMDSLKKKIKYLLVK
jgi:archaellum component FlaC